MSKKHLHNYSKPRLYKSRTKEKTCPKGLCKTIANRSQYKGNRGPDRNPHPVLTPGRVFRPLRILFMDLCCPFGPHWILKGSQNLSFSHKISRQRDSPPRSTAIGRIAQEQVMTRGTENSPSAAPGCRECNGAKNEGTLLLRTTKKVPKREPEATKRICRPRGRQHRVSKRPVFPKEPKLECGCRTSYNTSKQPPRNHPREPKMNPQNSMKNAMILHVKVCRGKLRKLEPNGALNGVWMEFKSMLVKNQCIKWKAKRIGE